MKFSRQKYWSGLPFPSLGLLKGKLELDTSSTREPMGHVHYQSVPFLCKALLTARLFNCEPYRGHCSFDLNISNMHPKDLSFRTDEIFPIFASFKTPKHKRCRQIPTKMVQDRFQHQCWMNWPPIG